MCEKEWEDKRREETRGEVSLRSIIKDPSQDLRVEPSCMDLQTSPPLSARLFLFHTHIHRNNNNNEKKKRQSTCCCPSSFPPVPEDTFGICRGKLLHSAHLAICHFLQLMSKLLKCLTQSLFHRETSCFAAKGHDKSFSPSAFISRVLASTQFLTQIFLLQGPQSKCIARQSL